MMHASERFKNSQALQAAFLGSFSATIMNKGQEPRHTETQMGTLKQGRCMKKLE